jgi:antitoxin MazE
MKTRVQKWGNSLALRIPKTLADEMGLQEDGAVELAREGGTLVVKPLPDEPPTLEELLAGITANNIHEPWETGPAQGREVW